MKPGLAGSAHEDWAVAISLLLGIAIALALLASI